MTVTVVVTMAMIVTVLVVVAVLMCRHSIDIHSWLARLVAVVVRM